MSVRPGEAQGPFPGNAGAIDGEVRRLEDLKDRLWYTGAAIRRLPIEHWAGPARDAFEEFRQRFGHQWLTAGDRHEDAAKALERYHSTLLELRQRAANADDSGAAVDLARWRAQLDSEGRAAAAAIRRAARALDSLPRLLTEPEPTAPPPAARPARTPPKIHTGPGLDPRLAHTDPAGFRRRVQELADAVRSAAIIVVTAPLSPRLACWSLRLARIRSLGTRESRSPARES